MSACDKVNQLLLNSGISDLSSDDIFRIATSKALKNEISIHPYGFHIIKIRITQEYQLRLHLWLQNIRPMQEPEWLPHDHCFDIDSLILTGEMRHKTWDIDMSSNNRGVIYDVAYQADTSILSKTTNITGLSLKKDEIYPEKCIYHLGREIFHSIEVPAEQLLSTLCVASKFSSSPSRVFGAIGGLDRYVFNRRKVPSDRISILMDAVSTLQEIYV